LTPPKIFGPPQIFGLATPLIRGVQPFAIASFGSAYHGQTADRNAKRAAAKKTVGLCQWFWTYRPWASGGFKDGAGGLQVIIFFYTILISLFKKHFSVG